MKRNYDREFINVTYDGERALYGESDALIKNCRFEGPSDGESCLKETSDLTVEKCHFALRYPLWHANKVKIVDCDMTTTCRAPLWYGKSLVINNLDCSGVKAVRECKNVTISDSNFISPEFCWLSANLKLKNLSVESEYPFFMIKRAEINNLKMKAKYSFQYAEDVSVYDSFLDTKDAFWHTKNVTVKNSVVKGEYLGWYSKNLTFVNCKIIGTQPLCYAENLKLIDCETENCDLSFENSVVDAEIKGKITSVKNPMGKIVADEIGEIIIDEHSRGKCEIFTASDK